MTRALLDVNVLLALMDREHVHHDRARSWFVAEGPRSWASCAMTQNGFLRVISQPRYSVPLTVADASRRLRDACATELHEFWNCDFSLVEAGVLTRDLLGSRSITDTYLLAMAVRKQGTLVTFDQHIRTDVVDGAQAEHVTVL